MTMTRSEAEYLAKGYAWARDDEAQANASKKAGETGGLVPWTVTYQNDSGYAFCQAYADRAESFYSPPVTGKYLPPVKDAWVNWQASKGKSIDRTREVTLLVTVAVPVDEQDENVADAVHAALRVANHRVMAVNPA